MAAKRFALSSSLDKHRRELKKKERNLTSFYYIHVVYSWATELLRAGAEIYKSSRPEVFCKKDILRNFAKFIGKHLCQSLFKNTFIYRTPPVAASGFRSKPKQLISNWSGCKFGKLSNWGLNLWNLSFLKNYNV